MRALRSVVPLSLAVLLAGCTAEPTAQPTRQPPGSPSPGSPSPAGPSPSRIAVQAVIDLKGREALGLTVDGSAVWAIAYQAGTLSRVDPATNAVTLTAPVRNAASALAADGSIWVAGYGGGPADSGLYRVDPATGRVVATVAVGEVCCDLSAGDGRVWVVDPGGGVLGVDTASNRVAQRLDVTLSRNVHVNAVYAGGSVWVSSDDTALTRIDVRTNARTTIETGGGVPFLARDGLVWGAAPNRLWAIRVSTGAIERRIDLVDSIEVISLELGFDAIWVGIRRPGRIGAVVKLDAATGQVRGEAREATIPARMAIGFGSVWVTDSGSGSLYRLAPGG